MKRKDGVIVRLITSKLSTLHTIVRISHWNHDMKKKKNSNTLTNITTTYKIKTKPSAIAVWNNLWQGSSIVFAWSQLKQGRRKLWGWSTSDCNLEAGRLLSLKLKLENVFSTSVSPSLLILCLVWFFSLVSYCCKKYFFQQLSGLTIFFVL